MKWRVLAFGKLMEGEAQYTITTYVTRGSYKYTQILFLTENNDEYMIYSPQNVTYPKGTKIKLLFLEKAQKYLILTFSGIFYKMENVIVYIIFLIWMAFYFSFVKKKY